MPTVKKPISFAFSLFALCGIRFNTAFANISGGGSFHLVRKANYSEALASDVLAFWTGILVWNINLLKTSGTYSVAIPIAHAIASLSPADGKLVLSGTGGMQSRPELI